jgi:5-(carboxyamino)imidazole ribonucleotide synthase
MTVGASLHHKTIGIFGGGQLARLMIPAAARYGVTCRVFDSDPGAPAFDLTPPHHIASFQDAPAIEAFARACDVITCEFENIPVAALRQAAQITPVIPDPDHFAMAQDRLLEKTMAQRAGLSVPLFADVSAWEDVNSFFHHHGPAILKRRHGGYDGKGQKVIRTPEDLRDDTITTLLQSPCLIEVLVPFTHEISTIGARGPLGAAFLPIGVNHHHHGILRKTTVPSALPESLLGHARQQMITVMEALNYQGILTMEWFVTAKKEVLFNECAPRVHNSGHWSLEGCSLSQFDLAVRTLLDMPLPTPVLLSPRVEMLNLLGDAITQTEVYSACSRAAVYDYGKPVSRPGRKMGHVTFF